MDFIHVFLLAVLQGVTELFPVSSLGHAILFSHWMGWGTDLKSPTLLPFLVALHLGTAVALFAYFWKDWFVLLKPNDLHPVFQQKNKNVLFYLVMSTIPAGLAGLLLEKKLGHLFGEPRWVALFLILNGFLLFAGEFFKRKQASSDLKTLTLKKSIFIGLWQIIALLPGFSRSGATLVGGLLMGFTHEAAAHFSFMLATPLIFAAAIYELPKLLHSDLHTILLPTLFGGVVAGASAYLSVMFLMRYMKAKEVSALIPFGIYCIVIGAITLVIG